ncbi:hypothetical protein O980_20955 [Mycobacterium avium subsp. paratuberculosis 08-8281]|nr:hypothetical protein O980_20955 [Mycobacterium avium subsp. paratuberculosis 08-8281]
MAVAATEPVPAAEPVAAAEGTMPAERAVTPAEGPCRTTCR